MNVLDLLNSSFIFYFSPSSTF